MRFLVIAFVAVAVVGFQLDALGDDVARQTGSQFVPANDRERALLDMIVQLRAEVATLKKQVSGLQRTSEWSGRVANRDRPKDGARVREGDGRQDSDRFRDGDRMREGDQKRDGDRGRERDQPRFSKDVPRSSNAVADSRVAQKAKKIFAAYDKNSDGFADFSEWLNMREGEMTDERRVREKTFFGEPAGSDGRITQEEFIQWVQNRQNGRVKPEKP